MARSAPASDDDASGPTGVDSSQPSCASPVRGDAAGQRHKQEHDAALASTSKTEKAGSSAARTAESIEEQAGRPAFSNRQQHDTVLAAAGQLAPAADADEGACTTSGASPEESNVQGGEAEGGPARAQQKPRHYWGQALQYLEKSADVTKGPHHHLLSMNISATFGDARAESLSQGLHAGFPSEHIC